MIDGKKIKIETLLYMYVDLSLFSVLNIKTLADTNEMH